VSLRDLNAPTRRRLRRHAWLLTIWCLFVGFVTSWLLLRVFDLRDPAARYGVAAVVMYSLGLVVGARFWLAHFSQTVAIERGVFGHAGLGDRAEFDDERERRDGRGERVRKAFDWSDLFGSVADWVSLDEAAALLIIPAIVFLLVGFVLLGGFVPVLLMDGVAGLLAEVALQFVFGALIARRVLRPHAHDAAFMTIVGKTWVAGLLLVVVSVSFGWILGAAHPGASSIGDLFR